VDVDNSTVTIFHTLRPDTIYLMARASLQFSSCTECELQREDRKSRNKGKERSWIQKQCGYINWRTKNSRLLHACLTRTPSYRHA